MGWRRHRAIFRYAVGCVGSWVPFLPYLLPPRLALFDKSRFENINLVALVKHMNIRATDTITSFAKYLRGLLHGLFGRVARSEITPLRDLTKSICCNIASGCNVAHAVTC